MTEWLSLSFSQMFTYINANKQVKAFWVSTTGPEKDSPSSSKHLSCISVLKALCLGMVRKGSEVEVKVAQSCLTLCDPKDSSRWNSPGHNTRAGSCTLLQGIFPSQGSNPGLPHCRQILYQPPRGLLWGRGEAKRFMKAVEWAWEGSL